MRTGNVIKIVFAAMMVTVSLAMAATPQSLVSNSVLLAGQTGGASGTAGNFFAHAIDGDTAYCSFSKGYITKITNIDGVQTSSVLVTPTDWTTANGGATSNLTNFYGFGVSGDYLIWTDTGSDAVWKADKTTGAISNVVTRSAIQNYLGLATVTNSVGAYTVDLNGGLTFFESTSQKILNVDMAGTLSTVATVGYSVVSGLTYDPAGNLYWGESATDTIYRLDSGGTPTAILNSAAIYAVTGGVNATFNDIFYGKNGWLYFYEQVDNSILQFNLSDPAATLSLLVETSGRANTFGLYSDAGQDYLTYHNYTGDLMAVAVPEPATVMLLTLGGLVLGRFRKR